MLFEDRALGGCTQAIGKGWNERVSSTSEDPRGWGRFMTTKLQGKKGKKLWITQLYAAYDKNPGPQSYWAMIKERMALQRSFGLESEALFIIRSMSAFSHSLLSCFL